MATRTQRFHRQRNREALLRTSREFGLQVGEAALLATVPWAKDEEKEDEEDEEDEEEIEAVKEPKEGKTPSETPPAADEPAAKTDEPPAETPPAETPAESVAETSPVAEKPPEEEEKPKEPPIETAPKPDEKAIEEEDEEDEEDEEEDEDEIDAECKRKMAAQLTMVITGLAPIEAFNPYPRQAGGLFGFKGGGMSDEGANAASESANAYSKAASHGAGSHSEAAKAHTNAANHAQRVANRSKMEYEMAMARGDKLSADAHAKELERATRGMTYHQMEATREAATPDTHSFTGATGHPATTTGATGTPAKPVKEKFSAKVGRAISNTGKVVGRIGMNVLDPVAKGVGAGAGKAATELGYLGARKGTELGVAKIRESLARRAATRAARPVAPSRPSLLERATEISRGLGAGATSSGMGSRVRDEEEERAPWSRNFPARRGPSGTGWSSNFRGSEAMRMIILATAAVVEKKKKTRRFNLSPRSLPTT